ncbi:MAG: hypothetical protein H8D47_02940 [Planctomycetes bacterium]|nr:hypothetical protein [Planctomycetota bacterium]MBL7105985.1 hypothetical protein [Phycisphaerae bacterium]
MKAKLWLSVVVTAVLLINFVGCKKAEEPETVEVKSQAEYKLEADKEITETNMEEELKKLEAEIEANSVN